MSDWPRTRRLSVLGLLGVVLAGCASANPTGQIGEFAAATKAYAERVGGIYEDVNRVTAERALSDLAAESDPIKVKGALAGRKVFQPIISDEALEARLALARALGNYADGLLELSTTDYRAGIDAAAQELGGAFKSLSDTVAGADPKAPALSDAGAGAITSVVGEVGNALAEEKRRAAIRRVVSVFDPPVQSALRQLVPAELDMLLEAQRLHFEQLYDRNELRYRQDMAQLSVPERRLRLDELWQSDVAVRQNLITIDQLKRASLAVADAHRALLQAVSTNEFGSDELARRIAELAGLVQSLQSLRQQLEPQRAAVSAETTAH